MYAGLGTLQRLDHAVGGELIEPWSPSPPGPGGKTAQTAFKQCRISVGPAWPNTDTTLLECPMFSGQPLN